MQWKHILKGLNAHIWKFQNLKKSKYNIFEIYNFNNEISKSYLKTNKTQTTARPNNKHQNFKETNSDCPFQKQLAI